jgi:ATP-dependent DNA helicase RecG
VTTLQTLEDIAAIRESWNIECKLAQGRDGHGALPEDIWESYSAFANTAGGNIFLGLRELGPGNYELAGIRDAEKVVAEFMKGVNDTNVVSTNVLCPDSVVIIHIDGKAIVHIHVPKASLYLRPVYVGTNPLHGSFVRKGDADIRLFPEKVKRMQAKVRGEMLQKA